MANRATQAAISQADLNGPLDTSTGLGLPPLQYGTVKDPLPTGDGWTPMQPYPNLGNFYCGNMTIMSAGAPFFPAALPSDGLMDLVTIDGDIPRRKALDLLLSVESNSFFDKPAVRYRKVSAVRVIPRYGAKADSPENELKTVSGNEGCFAVDGERLPFQPFQIEVHKGLGMVLSRRVGVYEAPGPKGWEDIVVDREQRSPSG